MVRMLLIRGMLVGIVAGLLAFGFAKLFGVPEVERAIAFEEQVALARGESPEPEIVGRAVQSGIGLLTSVVVYGTALGGLFALAFAFAYGRFDRLSPRVTAALLAGAALLVIVIIPNLKYPANPPAVGNPETMISLIASVFAIVIGRRLTVRYGGWNASLIAAAVFIGIIGVAQLLLPNLNEVSDQFPADVLWRFRIASLGMQLVLWTTLGLLFGALAERLLAGRYTRTGLEKPS
jgi:hypothetical protein